MSDYLNSLSLPGDLKDMSYDELELLTYEIRDFLVDKAVSYTHLDVYKRQRMKSRSR